MNQVLKNVLEGLRGASLDQVYNAKSYINELAISLYNKSALSQSEVEDLKDIITICNICYNDTDIELQIVEDGVYDVILEKYKTYDPNFQVGAEVINFKASAKNGMHAAKQMLPAITYVNDEDAKRVKTATFYDNLIIDPRNYITNDDFSIHPNPVDQSYINKRHHDTQHNHPELVGTLDKCKFVFDKDAIAKGVYNDSNVKTVERDFFMQHLIKGIITNYDRFDIVLELKYDGISVEADCTDEVVSARSRGDTGIGLASDLTPILKGYKFPHRKPGCEMIGVKFEAIITQLDLPFFNAAKGHEYRNCRSAIVGLLSSSDAWKYRDFITLVPLAVEKKVFEVICHSDRVEEINFLNSLFISKGCPLRYAVVNGNYIENLTWINLFTQDAESSRSFIPFMYDGVVLSYRDPRIRNILGRENYINKYSMAVKFNPLKKSTIFRGYSYTVGQNGVITPMIYYDPVEFYGTIHNKSSGQSYSRFMELSLRKGDIITVEYVNDVMPYVGDKPLNDFNIDNMSKTPLERFPTVCPVCGTDLMISNSSKSVRCMNPMCNGKKLARMTNMCSKLGLDGFGESTIARLDYSNLRELVNAFTNDPNYVSNIMAKGFGPVDVQNMKNQIDTMMANPIDETVLFGSLGFTDAAKKTWDLILPKISYQELRLMMFSNPVGLYNSLITIRGLGPSILNTIINEFKYFYEDLDYMYANALVIKSSTSIKKKVRLSGTRDKQLIEFLTANNFDVDPDASVTRDTSYLIIPVEGFESGKTKKARQYGVPILTVNDIYMNVDRYKV